MSETQDTTYNDAIIEAYIQKEDKTQWYQNAFTKIEEMGSDKPQWLWSWWGFFFGFGFLLYRKAYTPAIALFIISMLPSFVPNQLLSIALTLVIMIAAGGFCTYFIYSDFKKKYSEVALHVSDESAQIDAIREIGGYHQWLVWVYGVIVTLAFLATVAVILLPAVGTGLVK